MSRKYIADLEGRLITETISLGGDNPANVDFSTKAIASAAGVSEFTLFQRFGSKEKLISASIRFVCDEAVELFGKWIKDEKDSFEVFSARVLDYFLSHPKETMFLINYSAASSHVTSDPEAFARYREYILAHLDLMEPYFGKRSPDEAFLLWSSFFRRLLMDAQFVLSDLYPDVATYREMSAKVCCSGLSGFRKGKEE